MKTETLAKITITLSLVSIVFGIAAIVYGGNRVAAPGPCGSQHPKCGVSGGIMNCGHLHPNGGMLRHPGCGRGAVRRRS